NTTSQDIYIVGDVNSTQGGTNPAGNCFTHGGNSMSSIGDIAGSHNNFTYYEPNTMGLDCYSIIFGSGLTTSPSFGSNLNVCDGAMFMRSSDPEEKTFSTLEPSEEQNLIHAYGLYMQENNIVSAILLLPTIKSFSQ